VSALAARAEANRANARARYHRLNPEAGHYRCRRCGEPGHTTKTCSNPARGETVQVRTEGLVVRIQCSCGARIAGTFDADQVLEILAAHRHPRRRR
jgi:hypothetical protein